MWDREDGNSDEVSNGSCFCHPNQSFRHPSVHLPRQMFASLWDGRILRSGRKLDRERERAELGSIPSRSSRSIKERKGWKSGAQDRNSSTWEAEAWGLLWVQGQPMWLPSQFQASERYIVRPWLKIWMNASKQERLYWTTLMCTLMYKCDDTC